MAADIPEHSIPDTGQLRLTYAQIAEQLNVSGEAARVLVRRRGWFRIIPNRKGQPTIVVVTTADLMAEQNKRTAPPTSGDAEPGTMAGAVALLDRTLSRLVEAERRADDAERRARDAGIEAERARAEAQAALAEAGEAKQQATDTQQAAEALQRDLEAVRSAQAKAEGTAEAARAEAEAARQAATKADQDRAAAVAIADEAVRAAEDLRQAQAAKAGQGRWARIRAAWRGE